MELSGVVPATAWKSGRFRARAGSANLLFGQMYEDVSIELAAFPSRRRIFCIASAGCTAMKLSPHHDVVAVDLNPAQIAYVQRRLTGAAIERGTAERILEFGRALAPMAGWSRRRLRAFLELDDPKEQIVFWRRHFDTQRFRFAFAFLFSRFALLSVYSAAFLNCLPQRFGAVLRSRMERCFALHPNSRNPYARSLLLGETVFEQGVVNKESIELVCADAADFLEAQPPQSFDGFSLSNIADGTNATYRRRLFDAVKHAAAPGASVVLRSFGAPSGSAPTDHAAQDRSMLWGVVDVRPADAL